MTDREALEAIRKVLDTAYVAPTPLVDSMPDTMSKAAALSLTYVDILDDIEVIMTDHNMPLNGGK